ncbi:MAG: lysophospholipid acyltransferase family protein [Proteobacteria bacterium]|nr:lysophospholipid acyltransferase family protein [Pseudomonadota bacterium]
MAANYAINPKKKLAIKGIQGFIFLTGVTAKISWFGKEIIDELIEKSQPFIICAWHHDIYFSSWLLKDFELTALISSSKDGEYINQILSGFGFRAVRGSSTRGGIGAMKQLVRCLKDGNAVAITPDGPQGPIHKIQEGIVALAKMTGVPIIPWRYEASSCWKLNSWDSHKIPKPITKIKSVFGQPLYVPKSASSSDFGKYCQQLEMLMNDLIPEIKQLN